MAKMTAEQKKEMAWLKSIPNKEMKDAITALNAVLTENEMDLVEIDKKSKGATVNNLTNVINGLVEAEKAELIPESVAVFYNEHIVVDEDDGSGTEEGDGKTADGGKDAGKDKKDDKPKPKRPRQTKEEIQARYDAIGKMIASGKYTKKEIVDAICPKFPAVTQSTISTFVQDCMNPKYNKLPKLTVKGEDGKLSFAK